MPLYCSCPPYFDSDKVESNSPRGGRKEREAKVKIEKVVRLDSHKQLAHRNCASAGEEDQMKIEC